MLHFGIISETDPENGKARVQFPDADGIVSNWLPISVPKTLKDKFSIPFDVNEHVWCLMDDNLEYGVIGGAIYSKNELPGDLGDADIIGINFEQGLHIEYKRSTRILSITGGNQFKVNITGDVTVQSATKVKVIAPLVEITAAATNVSGNLTVVGIVEAGGFSGVTSGGGSGNMTVAGSITATGEITSGLIPLTTHKHTGVTTGGGVSGTPTP